MNSTELTSREQDDAPICPMFVSSDAVKTVLKWTDMIDRLRTAYSTPLDEKSSPPRTVARGQGAWLRTLTAVPPMSRYMGAKVFGMSTNRRVAYMIALFDRQSGGVVGLMDAYYVTSFRTGATSAVAVDRIASPGQKTVAILGSGSEANSHTRAIAAIRQISELRVFSPTQENREAFARRMQAELAIPAFGTDSAEAAVDGADIIVACARSRDELPILHGSWLRPGAVVVSIGSTVPEQREIDASVADVCDLIVCDMVDEVVEQTGDMIAAREAGVAFENKLVGLNEILLGKADERLHTARLPMFKSVGSALQDIVIAELAFDLAIERGLATPLSADFQIRNLNK